MKKSKISFASSISFDKGYAPMDTLAFCKEKNIKRAQLFMDKSLMGNAQQIDKISKFAKQNNIAVTCHAPTPLNKNFTNKELLDSLQKILKYQDEKKVIIHFDPNAPLAEIMMTIESINDAGLTICLENFYPETSRYEVIQNISAFNIILTLAAEHEFNLIPVIDFPRLFINNIKDHADSLLLTEMLINTVAIVSNRLILHLIDFDNYDQKRNSWVPIGEGKMPYKTIFNSMKKLGIEIDEAVLEYEDKKLATNSVEPILELAN